MNSKRLVAHRGDNKNHPENSYAAFEAALKAGALYIEFDIQMNADGSLLVFHDIDFKRVGNNDTSIFETTDKQLKELSAHEPDRFGDKHFPTPVLYLDDLITLLKQYPKVNAFVEIKRESLVYWGLSEIIDKVLIALDDVKEQATIISFSSSALKYVQQHSKFRIGLVFYQYNDLTYNLANILQPDFLICAYTVFPEKNNLWQGNWQWVVYSINDSTVMQQVAKRDEITLIETDSISSMLKEAIL